MSHEAEKLLGIDYGERRVGLAIAEGSLAEPLTILGVQSQKEALEKVADICRREWVAKIVIGLPRDSEGNPTLGAEKVKEFSRRLQKELDVPVAHWNETLTSRDAVAKMVEAGAPRKKRRRFDDIVAAMILQEYLDSKEG